MNKGQIGKAPAFDPSDYPHAIAQLSRLGSAIEKEFTLVSDRMNWMVISESFIFTAFATAAAYWITAGKMQPIVAFLLFLMPILGAFLAWIVIPAIKAAHEAARRLKDQRDKIEERLPPQLRLALISSKDPEHGHGNWPAHWVPRFIIGVWVILLGVVLWCFVSI